MQHLTHAIKRDNKQSTFVEVIKPKSKPNQSAWQLSQIGAYPNSGGVKGDSGFCDSH